MSNQSPIELIVIPLLVGGAGSLLFLIFQERLKKLSPSASALLVVATLGTAFILMLVQVQFEIIHVRVEIPVPGTQAVGLPALFSVLNGTYVGTSVIVMSMVTTWSSDRRTDGAQQGALTLPSKTPLSRSFFETVLAVDTIIVFVRYPIRPDLNYPNNILVSLGVLTIATVGYVVYPSSTTDDYALERVVRNVFGALLLAVAWAASCAIAWL